MSLYNLSHMSHGSLHYDVCIIGGGINGAGIARDLAGRGAKVFLCEKGDLASATSSSSTKLIHGGLRYLEYFDFGLVRKALKERKLLLKMAPHIIRPMRFVLPHNKKLRPRWLVRLGLFLYDHLALRDKLLPSSKGERLKNRFYGEPLLPQFKKGFSYSDCWVDDARLVVLNALSAAEKGANISSYTYCKFIERRGGRWLITLHDEQEDFEYCITASMVVNASGPWVKHMLDVNGLTHPETLSIRKIKGSHIIVPKMYEGGHSYMIQQQDGRIMFVIPYEDEFTLIGTTEEEVENGLDDVKISCNEIDYLCASVNATFKKKVGPDDIIWSYSGVRPLIEDGAKDNKSVTRDYKLVLEHEGEAPLLSVYGGKITTYRILAEKAARLVQKALPALRLEEEFTHHEPLPGGEFSHLKKKEFTEEMKKAYPWLLEDILERYIETYGTRIHVFLEGLTSMNDLGQDFGAGLYGAEVDYLMTHEYARTAEDILFRRTKLGLKVSHAEEDRLRHFIHAYHF